MDVWWKEVFRGKSFIRASLNEALGSVFRDIHGTWLDIGGGSGPSYLRFLPPGLKRIATDMKPSEGVIAVDANAPLPFTDGEFDGIFAMNMLYIVEHPKRVLEEMKRVLKPGGTVVATFPFFFAETPEPHDYHRWTSEGVAKLLVEGGWQCKSITPIGGIGAVFATHALPGNRFLGIHLAYAVLVRIFDRLFHPRVAGTWLAVATKE